MKAPENIIKFANDNNYETASYLGVDDGYNVYKAIYKADGKIYRLGYTVVILDKNGNLEWVQDDRSLAILSRFKSRPTAKNKDKF